MPKYARNDFGLNWLNVVRQPMRDERKKPTERETRSACIVMVFVGVIIPKPAGGSGIANLSPSMMAISRRSFVAKEMCVKPLRPILV
jgi:hypothetical protein